MACPICKKLICDAQVLKCGHSYCQLCIEEHLVNDSVLDPQQTCAACNSVVRKKVYTNSLNLTSIIMKLRYCEALDETNRRDLLAARRKLREWMSNRK